MVPIDCLHFLCIFAFSTHHFSLFSSKTDVFLLCFWLFYMFSSTGSPVSLEYEAVRLWTNDFCEEQRIGQGGFGSVFNGYIHFEGEAALETSRTLLPSDRRRVAVKKISTALLTMATSAADEDRGKLERNALQVIFRSIFLAF